MTVELAHPSTEPLGSRSSTEMARPRLWFFKTTPGRIVAIGLALAMLGGASAFSIASTIERRQNTLTTVLNRSEPLAYAAAQLYTTLSVADAAAATAFIAETEPQAVRQRYEQAITNAAVAVTLASSGLTDDPSVQLLGRINAELTIYAGLIEVARTNNRAGDPVGSSYLSEASELMQHEILPDAQRLYETTSTALDARIGESTQIPVLVVVVVTATVLFGAYAHRWLVQRTRRRINLGLVAGGLAIGLMVIWVGTVLIISAAGGRTARNTAGGSLRAITTMAITAQQARSDETLALIRRGDEEIRKRTFYQNVDSLQHQLTDYVGRDDAVDKTDLANAEGLLTRWRQANDRINAYILVGNYRAATRVALGDGEDDSAPAFSRIDAALEAAMQHSRNQLRGDLVNARRVLSVAPIGGALLSVGAAVAVVMGLWPRLSEYK